jgi:MarR family transcriptional regulator for hemolysin
MDLDRSFGFLVHDVARLFGRRFNQRALLFLGLTRAQCKVLGYLARNEGINQAGLADLLEIKPMTLVRQIDRMEEDGWIERRPQPGDRRARRLVLTDKARPILARILDLSNEIRTEAFAGLSREEGRHLLELLRRVHANLSERVPPLAAEFADLDETSGLAAEDKSRADGDLSPVGGAR